MIYALFCETPQHRFVKWFGNGSVCQSTFSNFLIIIIVVIGCFGCSNIPSSDFYEVDGLITGSITDSLDVSVWNSVQFINSRGLENQPADTAKHTSLTFSVYISTPGNYSVWFLAANPGVSGDSLTVDITITDSDNFLVSQVSVGIPKAYGLRWQRANTGYNSNLVLFGEPGQYKISITARDTANIQLHKFQMSLNNTDQPYGLGLPSSTRTDLSSADLFQELPLMLPPAWAFNPIIGFDVNSSGKLQQVLSDESAVTSAGLGGVWTRTVSDFDTFDTGDEGKNEVPARGFKVANEDLCVSNLSSLFTQGYSFLVTHQSPGVDCLNRLHQEYRNLVGDDRRPLIFHGIKNAYDAQLKQYPAPMTPKYEFKWSASPLVENGNFQPGGYSELVDDLSSPAGSLYNMPFLSLPVNYPPNLSDNSDWDSELFIKTVQLSVFLPIMHVILPGFVDQLSDPERSQLLKAMRLRNSLFPYTYTHAHYTRQSNESVISGFRQYPDQFMYGNAFLVAPVMQPGTDGRIVYFPEGRLWYNFYTGEAFDAGRSWFVETQRNQLPLFVKAGSVIPYQSNEDTERLSIEIYTGDAGALRLVEDDGQTRAYRRTAAARTMLRYNEVEGNLKFTIGAVQAGFEGMRDYRTYDIYFKHAERPNHIEINSKKLVRATASEKKIDGSSWQYDETESEIVVNLNDVSRYEKLDIVIYP